MNAPTPGFNTRITIRFTSDKRGRPLAHYWSAKGLRWLRMGLDDAKILVAADQADKAPPPDQAQGLRDLVDGVRCTRCYKEMPRKAWEVHTTNCPPKQGTREAPEAYAARCAKALPPAKSEDVTNITEMGDLFPG